MPRINCQCQRHENRLRRIAARTLVVLIAAGLVLLAGVILGGLAVR
jgi:hypothetical protein